MIPCRLQIIQLLLLFLLFTSCQQKKSQEKASFKEYSIEDFYKNKSVKGGAFSSNEKKLLISSNETGIFNLYEINLSDTSKKQLTRSVKESFNAIDYVPNSEKVLYSADSGGNEIAHIFLLREDGTSEDLTPGKKEKAEFFGWDKDKTSFYFLSNKRNQKYFDLYKMDNLQWQANLIYTNEKGYDIGEISWDGKWIALMENITTSQNKLFLFNTSTSELKELSDSKNPGTYIASGFTKNNKSFFFITDSGKEFQYLAKYDLTTDQSTVEFQSKWDVMYSYDSENEKYKVIAINEDGKNRLIIKNNTTNKNIDFPALQDGDVTAVAISPDENYLRLTVGSSKASSNIFLYEFSSKKLKQITNTRNPKINPDHLVSAEVVRYKSFDGLEIPAIYYKPVNATRDNKVPGIIFVHGGPGGQSRKDYSPLIQYLVNHGYAILAVNNRGSSGYGKTFYKMDDRNHGEKDLMDCVYGKKYLQSLNYIDTGKIGIFGGSYGGYMTMAAMAFKPNEFKVGVNVFGVTNWLRTLKSIPPYWESFRKALYAELGDPTTADSLRLRNISPLFHAEKIKNPVMVLQGANDPRVLRVESDEIVNEMKKNNIPVEYLVFPDEGHGFKKKENEIKAWGAVLKFLDKNLKDEGAKIPKL